VARKDQSVYLYIDDCFRFELSFYREFILAVVIACLCGKADRDYASSL